MWQHDLCGRIEKAFWLARSKYFRFKLVQIGAGPAYAEAPSGFKIPLEEFEEGKRKGTRAAIHAPPQFGKSIIISQCYPAWILGYDPTHRFRLATYNISHSKAFSEVVLQILRGPEHQAIFTDPDGWPEPRGMTVKWYTRARRKVKDGQSSFTALGLQSGFVGTGADTLLMDDPYKSIEEALSEIIREKSWRFYTDTAKPRLDEESNVFIMFHRYHQADIAGMAIASGEFDLIRYAAEADGDYEDEESGRSFPDPIGRPEGQYLSPRKPVTYYLRQKANEQAWNSQFQGRPTSKAGNFFDVSSLDVIHPDRVPEILHRARGWDNAATEGAGAFTAGVLSGVDSAGMFYIFDVARDQVNTAGREALQEATAEKDGKLVTILHPQDPGSAGKDIAFQFVTKFKDWNVISRPVSGKKEARAYNFSLAVNSGKYRLVLNRDGSVPEWHKPLKEELKHFPVGTNKDQADAGADTHNHLEELLHRGLCIKGFNPSLHLATWEWFAQKFGARVSDKWDVAAAVRVAPDATLPSGFTVAARAPESAGLGEVIFVLAACRMFTADRGKVLSTLKEALVRVCASGAEQAGMIWLSRKSQDVTQLATVKYSLPLYRFEDEETAGLGDVNWYFQKGERPHAERGRGEGARIYLLTRADQLAEAKNEGGMLSLRQDLVSWAFNGEGVPQPYGGVTADCLRMVCFNFALSAAPLTTTERWRSKLAPELSDEAVEAKRGTPEFPEAVSAQRHAINVIRREEEREEEELRQQARRIGAAPVRQQQEGKRKKSYQELREEEQEGGVSEESLSRLLGRPLRRGRRT